jgi:hypothetical protein
LNSRLFKEFSHFAYTILAETKQWFFGTFSSPTGKTVNTVEPAFQFFCAFLNGFSVPSRLPVLLSADLLFPEVLQSRP